jgi:hypothetical protein
MGFFRRHKTTGHTVAQVKRLCADAEAKVRFAVRAGPSNEDLVEAMTDWACWRELLARLQGDNEGREG